MHLPPAACSRDGEHTDEMDPAPLADVQGTIVTFTIDRMAYSPSPPVVFAVVDFDGGGRLPVELTDVDADEMQIGDRVEMTFRRLYASDGIVNYFWKGQAGARWVATASRTASRSSAWGARTSSSTGTRASTTCSSNAANDAYASAGIDKDDVDAYWLGTAQGGMSGITLARPLQLDDKPVTRVENFCATGSEALRQAAYAVASGAYDVAMAIGVEKTKDGGYQGLNAVPAAERRHAAARSPRRRCSRWSRPPTRAKYGVDADKMREAMAHVAWKNHYNGARNPRAQFRREVSMETICNVAEGGRRPRRVRLRGRRRRLGRRDRRARRRRATSTPTSRSS